MSIALLLLFLGLSALGVPLAVALGLASVAVIMMFTSTPIISSRRACSRR